MVDASGRTDVIGTVVEIERRDGRVLRRRVRTAASYLAANDPRVLFGLGDDPRILRVRAIWPDGSRESWKAPPVDGYTVLRRGTGRAVNE
jgi:hypothetical protein